MTDSGRRIRSCDKGRLESDTFYTWVEIIIKDPEGVYFVSFAVVEWMIMQVKKIIGHCVDLRLVATRYNRAAARG